MTEINDDASDLSFDTHRMSRYAEDTRRSAIITSYPEAFGITRIVDLLTIWMSGSWPNSSFALCRTLP